MELEGRIIKGVGGLYTVATAEGPFECRPRGLFRNQRVTPLVGDEVTIRIFEGGERGKGSVTGIRPRRSELVRPRVANADQVVVVFAAKSPAINYDLLDSYLLALEHIASGTDMAILLCVNKTDLCGRDGRAAEEYRRIGYPVFYVSALPETRAGIDELRGRLAGKVSVFAGPSGVGKSSIINSLLDYEKMPVGSLSRRIERGRHTTRHSELIELEPGCFIIDSPGFTSLSLAGVAPEALAGLFIEFRPYLGQCRFADCRHIAEPGCAVRERVGGAVSEARYLKYVKVYRELEAR